ncbi:MAG: dihydroxy-acid dehydratase, partial [Methyloligellaceae bacterium]
ISDARRSGTAYGTVVLHTSPEAAEGGPLALVRNGDMVELNVAERRLHLDVSEDDLQRRKAEWSPGAAPARGYWRMYHDHVMQADRGCDFDFLVGSSGAPVPRESH